MNVFIIQLHFPVSSISARKIMILFLRILRILNKLEMYCTLIY